MAIDEYAYDGEVLSTTTLFHGEINSWKPKWIINYFHKNCMNWILTFNNTYMTPPDVYIFAMKASDDDSKLNLSCLATGFYPREVEMNLRLDRNILEDQTSSGLRPNDDETFQLRTSVKINRDPKGSYDCFVIHSSLTKTVSAEWGSPDIRVFAKDAPDDQHKQVLTCLVTVIYPRDTEMNIRLNKTVLKDQTSSEIRPNADGSFQLSISVEIDKNHKGLYDCLVFHSSLTEPVSVKWDGEYFDNKTESQSLVIVGVAAAAVVAGLVLLFWFCLKFQKVSSNSTCWFKRDFKMYETGMGRVTVYTI
ncbi:Beta-2-microglobulin [Labeo rohita]|uniref:Beta-2-microglobulin n=1 Tax=Labeo rohita TaxID=84645 RepID=A0ABQ8MXU1_LABRO|nr:Beta-2-microglobulin [Labeo rohita]